ncbi:aldo/keto reductase [Anaerobacillus alkalidiazotrophicus]|uniref:Aldo/keto reductase n=1 Tax=Anaerobacillus alkalidiazotrophicus TaxID=472963 RepID=A0A1S2M0Z7_9BACI|nr:aldo/keto reductase [Anaerobacillus alkalidiazotrophicus]OIJ18143.1 aldo/keto reductase [Anaerobacillus alkalidiazotrophicus]OIJ19622.1 aldo/keto reductase [Anaerobacillus alkalidiazotrophicus]
MKVMPLQKRKISNSRLLFGCMGLGGGWNQNGITEEDIILAEKAIDAALSIGITMFDHADIYTFGKAEQVFGEVLKRSPQLREQIVLQSKCGIRFPEGKIPNRYDFSTEHIINSVDGILARLGVEYIDILLLHRPDPLIEPDEVADTFEILEKSGKVRNFGVSNMNVAQMKLLQSYCSSPIVVNQLEMNLHKLDWLEQGVLVNQSLGTQYNFSDGIIEHCRLEDIQIQAWGPLAKGIYSGKEVENVTESYLQTKQLVKEMAEKKETTMEAIVLGWLMRHPALIQPVIGSANETRIKNCEDATRQSQLMTRDEWYSLYVASRGKLMP